MNCALWHTSPTKSELRAVKPPPDTALVAVESSFSMVSTGTERLVATGRAALAGAALDAPYVEGDFGFPIKYGYSLVGRDYSGNIVHCLHPHQSVAYVHADDLYTLPESVSPRRAALLSNMETVVMATWDVRLDDHQDVMLCGFGNIGALLANTLRLDKQLSPVIVETDKWRRDKAGALGFEAIAPEQYSGTHARIIDSSCSAAGLQFCIDHCAPDGIIVELSWYGVDPLNVNLGGAFHRNRVQLLSSQVSTIPAHLQGRETSASRKDIASDLLADASFDELITNEVAFADSPAFFDALRDGRQGDGLIWLITY
ncbi:MAG: zinc-binding alcohol dehydrogenase [Gammaproteobacteria bacterium]|nr:zinc-binding alcohol dehydrogenase [Gammaproteobacteria bacterium]MDH3749229.1 zinc-binding alcohol dehydrogenase [Gammaproteobacteria bacterium]MDH3803889.1 zinc-binding alcohol dehydrogenase [Gammaproteobacteria bacterium]